MHDQFIIIIRESNILTKSSMQCKLCSRFITVHSFPFLPFQSSTFIVGRGRCAIRTAVPYGTTILWSSGCPPACTQSNGHRAEQNHHPWSSLTVAIAFLFLLQWSCNLCIPFIHVIIMSYIFMPTFNHLIMFITYNIHKYIFTHIHTLTWTQI